MPSYLFAILFALAPLVPRVSAAAVYKERITPHWLQNGNGFWYRNDLRADSKEFILVDAERGTRRPAFDHSRLAAALSKAAGAQYEAERLPFDSIEFEDDATEIRFNAGDQSWACNLKSYECKRVQAAEKKENAT